MKFNKREIAEFKAKGRSYIMWRKNLKIRVIKEFFYNNDDAFNLEVVFPDKKIEYCYLRAYDVVVGDYKLGLKYIDENGDTYYMFCAANTYWAYPQDVAIGKVVDGIIYFIRETFPNDQHALSLFEVPEEYINKRIHGFVPECYKSYFFSTPANVDIVEMKLTDEEVKCIKIAYEGVRSFSKLIDDSPFNFLK